MKTYANKSNARRGAAAANLNPDKLHFVKVAGGRWTWEQPRQARQTRQTRSTKAEVKHDVQAPMSGVCRTIWDFCEKQKKEKQIIMKPKAMKKVAEDKGWNKTNAVLAMYKWRHFNGITGRQ